MTDDPAARAAVADCATELLGRLTEITDDVVAKVHLRVPEIGEDQALAAETWASANASISLVLRALAEGVLGVMPEPPEAALVQAHRYVQSGGDLNALLRTYRIGHEEFWTIWLAYLRRQVPDADTLAAAVDLSTRFTFSYVDDVSTFVVKVFSAERERWVRSASALRSETVRAILAGGSLDATTAGRRLHYDLNRPHLAFLVWCEPTEQDVLGMLEERAGRVGAALGGRTSLLVPLGRLTIAGWVSKASDRLDRVAVTLGAADGSGPAVRAAVGAVETGLEGFRTSHVQAAHARRIAELSGLPAGSIQYFHDVALVALTTQDQAFARWLVRYELNTLADGSATNLRLAATAATFLAEGSSPARTARKLGVHENTVTYRVRAAEKLIGHPLDERRLETGVALRLLMAFNAADAR